MASPSSIEIPVGIFDMRFALDMCYALDMPCGASGIDIISNRVSDISILQRKNIEPRQRHIDKPLPFR